MRAAIVVTDPSDWTAQALLASFSRKGIVADFLNFKDLVACIDDHPSLRCAGLDLTEMDAILVRDLGRSGASDVAFRFETLMALQERGVDVINPPPAIARAANKFATSLALQRAGVPTPRTAVTTSMEEAQAVLQNLGRAVSKPLFGFKGREIFLLQDGIPIFTEVNARFQGSTALGATLAASVSHSDILMDHLAANLRLDRGTNLTLEDWLRELDPVAHLVVHNKEAVPVNSIRPTHRRATRVELVPPDTVRVDPGGVLGRLVFNEQITSSGYELEVPLGAQLCLIEPGAEQLQHDSP